MPGKITTSTPASRSTKNDNKKVVVNVPYTKGSTPSPTPSPSPGPKPIPVASSATNKGQLPVLRGKGSKASVAKYISAEWGQKYAKDEYTFINSKTRLKNPYTGKFESYSGYFIPKVTKPKNTGGGGGGGGNKKPASSADLPIANPDKWNWNLPPHAWSRPIYHTQVLGDAYPEGTSPKSPPNDKYRRGRLWWKATGDVQIRDKDGNLTKTTKSSKNKRYGFQFIWNPETFSTSVSMDLAITPNVNDRFLGVAGAFPASEMLSFNIRLDRTNDFACAAAGLKRPSEINRNDKTNIGGYPYVTAADAEQFVKFYKGDHNWKADEKFLNDKVKDLLARGTIADLEYLYRAINGEGPGANQPWINGRGVQTADIGFLMPTLLHIDIGPLSYDGYVKALSVNHIAFTPDMVPIRTDLSISIELLATAGLASREATE